MKNYYSDLSLKLNFEIINKVKLAREASQEHFAFLTTKYQQMAKAEHLICPKGGGGHKPTFAAPPPTFESAGAQAPAAILLCPCWTYICTLTLSSCSLRLECAGWYVRGLVVLHKLGQVVNL